MIAVLDLDIGNTGSILNILAKLNSEAKLTSQAKDLLVADKIILSGVGAFDSAIEAITQRRLYEPLREAVMEQGKPILGICLGMQLLANKSEEGTMSGFGFVPGKVVRFGSKEQNWSLPVPHMGWNRLSIIKDSPITKELPERSRFYFMHSYHFVCDNEEDAVAETQYGLDFTSIVQKQNILGVQFHPEKSHRYGLAILRHFAEMR